MFEGLAVPLDWATAPLRSPLDSIDFPSNRGKLSRTAWQRQLDCAKSVRLYHFCRGIGSDIHCLSLEVDERSLRAHS